MIIIIKTLKCIFNKTKTYYPVFDENQNLSRNLNNGFEIDVIEEDVNYYYAYDKNNTSIITRFVKEDDVTWIDITKQTNKKPKHQTKYGDEECKDKVWKLAKIIEGCDPKMYREDPYGNKICYTAYGKNENQSWQIDHIKPSSKGGSDNLRNLQALNSSVNQSKGNNCIKKSRHSKC
jgi:hypothetical protein